jgi:hypothetical protein
MATPPRLEKSTSASGAARSQGQETGAKYQDRAITTAATQLAHHSPCLLSLYRKYRYWDVQFCCRVKLLKMGVMNDLLLQSLATKFAGFSRV